MADISIRFKGEQDNLLREMEIGYHPGTKWPEGCYGSLRSWLLFVGPSPGGGKRNSLEFPRRLDYEMPVWNEDYTEPCESWSNGFRTSMRILVERILGRSEKEGALKLYGFVNFDWIQNPDGSNVPKERMRRGCSTVLEVLNEVRPKIIVTMGYRAHQLLTKLLDERYKLNKPNFASVCVLQYESSGHCHRSMNAYKLSGKGRLNGSIIVKSPQHPARIFNSQYAIRCANAIRKTIVAIEEGSNRIEISES